MVVYTTVRKIFLKCILDHALKFFGSFRVSLSSLSVPSVDFIHTHGYHLYAIYSQIYLTVWMLSQVSDHKSNLITPAWMPHWHLRLNLSKIELLASRQTPISQPPPLLVLPSLVNAFPSHVVIILGNHLPSLLPAHSTPSPDHSDLPAPFRFFCPPLSS